MNCEKKMLNIYRQGKTFTDQFYVDEDYNVPDTKADIREVIESDAVMEEIDLKLVENYIRITGRLAFQVLYVADNSDNTLSSLEGKIPFEEMYYVDETLEETLFLKAAQTELTVNLIHSRKINVKAMAEVIMSSDSQVSEEVTTGIESGEQIYTKYQEKQILTLHTVKKDTYRIKEQLTISGTKESIGNILWKEVLSRRLDTRLEADTLKLQGELLVFCLYESVDGKTDWICENVPYEGQVECFGAEEGMYHQIYPILTDALLEPAMDEDGEMRLLGIEATLSMRFFLCTEEKIQILDDLYSLKTCCVPAYTQCKVENVLMQNHSKCKIAERLSLPEIKDDILQICYSDARIQVEQMTVQDTGIQIEGVLHIRFMYVRPDDQIPFALWQGMVPFSWLLESNEVQADMTLDMMSSLEQLGISLLGNGEIEVKAVLAFRSFLRGKVTFRNMDSVEEKEIDYKVLEQRPGIIGYIVKEGDELWNLAKYYGTTKEGIMDINHMESEQLKCGDKLLIFKENASIL